MLYLLNHDENQTSGIEQMPLNAALLIDPAYLAQQLPRPNCLARPTPQFLVLHQPDRTEGMPPAPLPQYRSRYLFPPSQIGSSEAETFWVFGKFSRLPLFRAGFGV